MLFAPSGPQSGMVRHCLNAQVCVVGGGPAGASAARRLAMLGHSVVLIEKLPFPRPHIGESLTGGILPLLDVLQIRGEIEREGFLRTSVALIRWGGAAEVRETAGAPGFQVDRARFDKIVLKAAENAGATILNPARTVDLARGPSGRWAIVARNDHGDIFRIESDFVVDATGRASTLGGRRKLTGPRTIALYAYWKNSAIAGPETRVEAGPAEWYWGAPLPNGLLNATVFVDAGRLREERIGAQSITDHYYRLVASSEFLRACLAGTRVGPVRVCDATCSSVEEPMSDGVLKAGESAFTIDPLSSQGVQTAMGSALHTGAIIQTMLERPANHALAEEFYRERQRRSVLLHRDAAMSLYAGAAYRSAFWLDRSHPKASHGEVDNDPTPAMELNPKTILRLNIGMQFREVPIVEGAFVIGATAVSVPQMREPLIFVDGIKIAPLIWMLDRPMRCDQILASWEPYAGPNTALRILQVACENRLLVLFANAPDVDAGGLMAPEAP
jgi:flavin-dependent dehydrogenase